MVLNKFNTVLCKFMSALQKKKKNKMKEWKVHRFVFTLHRCTDKTVSTTRWFKKMKYSLELSTLFFSGTETML